MSTREKDIENAVLTYLAAVPGFEAWKVNTTGVYDVAKQTYRRRPGGGRIKGVSDIIGFYRGKFWAIEIKTPVRRNELTDEQREFLAAVNVAGQIGIVITSVDEIIKFIREMKGKK